METIALVPTGVGPNKPASHPAHGFSKQTMAEGVFVNAIRAVKETLTSRGGGCSASAWDATKRTVEEA